GAAPRRPRRESRASGRAPVPRGAGVADLRRRDRGAEGDHRAGVAQVKSAHVDTFAHDNLPPKDLWPELRFDLPEFRYPERMNCAAVLLDEMVKAGHGNRIAIRAPDGECT